MGLVHPKWLKHDDTPGLVHLLERRVLLRRKQRWAKQLLVFLLCSLETKEVSLALQLVGKSFDHLICEKRTALVEIGQNVTSLFATTCNY
jgi:hypothetical protein